VTNQPRPRLGALLRDALTAADVGSRVTVRRTVDGGFGDVVGELLEHDGTTLLVRTRRRGDVRVAAADVVAARRIEPRA
jgi:hypothetical protein